jgi:hypothetical protein
MQVPGYEISIRDPHVSRYWETIKEIFTVLVPLVGPERLIVTTVVLPVLIHVGEELSAARLLDDSGDVAVFPRLITELLICAVAVIRPCKMSVLEL